MLRYTYDPPYNQWYGIKNKNLLRFKVTYGGTVATASDLPIRGFMPGVMFNVQEDGSNYMWNGLTWDKMDSNPFVGATSSKDGIQGLVPEPKIANREGFLYGGGGWKNLDASDVKTGVFALARIPAAAMERLVTVADQTERYALTTATVQNGDTVLQSDTQVMYRVVDQTKLDDSAGYVEYQAARASVVPWSGVTGVPETFTPSAHTHGNITNDGKVGTTTDKPLITTTGGVVTTGSFGSTAGTFCEGNDLRLKVVSDFYFDADNGSDNNDGLTQNTPLLTVNAALTKIQNGIYKFTSIINFNFASSQNSYDAVSSVPGYKINLFFNNSIVRTIQATSLEFMEIFGTVTVTEVIASFRGGVISIHNNANITFKDISTTSCFTVYASGLIYTVGSAKITINLDNVNEPNKLAVLYCVSNGNIHLSGTETWTGSFTGDFYRVNESSAITGVGTPSIASGATYNIDTSSSFN